MTAFLLAERPFGLDFLESYAWQSWIAAALLLLVAEALASGFFFLALVPGALLAAWAAAFDASWKVQLFAFAGGVLVGLIWIRPFFLQRALDRAERTNVEALIGQRARVVQSIPEDGVGRVRLRSEEWRAISDTPIEQGADVIVVGVEGNSLRVERA